MTAQRISITLVVGGEAPTRALLRSLLSAIGSESYEVASLDALAMAPSPAETTALVLITAEATTPFSRLLIRLRRLGYQAPAVLLAHRPSRALRRRALALGVVDVVGLPADPRELRVRLRVAFQEPGPEGLLTMLPPDDH